MSVFVSSAALDLGAIARHGFDTMGQGTFHLFQCPHCHHIYVYDDGLLRIYPNPANGEDYIDDIQEQDIPCIHCGFLFSSHPVIGDTASPEYRVSWNMLRASEWHWIATYNPAFGDTF